MDIEQAIHYARPNAEWVLRGNTYAGLEWFDGNQTKPTEQEISDAMLANDYKEKRKGKYPSLNDLADAIYWKEKGDPSFLEKYISDCDKVKSDNPKP